MLSSSSTSRINSPFPRGNSDGTGSADNGPVSSGYRRDVNREHGPLAEFAVHVDKSPMVLHDGEGRREAETSALAHILGGKKGLKYSLLEFLGIPVPVSETFILT